MSADDDINLGIPQHNFNIDHSQTTGHVDDLFNKRYSKSGPLGGEPSPLAATSPTNEEVDVSSDQPEARKLGQG